MPSRVRRKWSNLPGEVEETRRHSRRWGVEQVDHPTTNSVVQQQRQRQIKPKTMHAATHCTYFIRDSCSHMCSIPAWPGNTAGGILPVLGEFLSVERESPLASGSRNGRRNLRSNTQESRRLTLRRRKRGKHCDMLLTLLSPSFSIRML